MLRDAPEKEEETRQLLSRRCLCRVWATVQGSECSGVKAKNLSESRFETASNSLTWWLEQRGNVLEAGCWVAPNIEGKVGG